MRHSEGGAVQVDQGGSRGGAPPTEVGQSSGVPAIPVSSWEHFEGG